jgi:glycosyltransferase involved in cell wall biosynthesis
LKPFARNNTSSRGGGLELRILHVTSCLDIRDGGPIGAAIGLAEAQRRAGASVMIASAFRPSDEPQAAAERLRESGVETHLIGPTVDPFLRWHPAMRGRLGELAGRADIVHIHALWEEMHHQAARAARRAGVPYIFRPAGMLDPWSLAQGKWRKRLFLALRLRRHLDRAAAIHFTTDIERDRAASLKLSAPAIVEPNGLDFAEFDDLPEPGAFRRRHPELLGDGRPMILFLSRLHFKKGLDLLLPAFAKAKTEGAALVLAGPESEAGISERLWAMIRDLGLEGRVLLPGLLLGRERIEAFADADLFVLPSRQENFAIAVAEALAAGTPVVVSDQVNIHPEVVAGGVGSAVPLDADALAAELSRWMGDPVLRREAAAKARPFARERWDWNAIARRWLAHDERLIAAKTP